MFGEFEAQLLVVKVGKLIHGYSRPELYHMILQVSIPVVPYRLLYAILTITTKNGRIYAIFK